MMERFEDRFVGILVLHIFADDPDDDFSFRMEDGM